MSGAAGCAWAHVWRGQRGSHLLAECRAQKTGPKLYMPGERGSRAACAHDCCHARPPRAVPDQAPTRAPRRRRSYGRVYKGRWRSGTVAIKVIAHDGSVASQISGLRESLLCKNITHPNVVRAPRRPPGAPARARLRNRRGPYAPATGAGASSHGRCCPPACPRRPLLAAEAHLSGPPVRTKQPHPHTWQACGGGAAGTRTQSHPSAVAALTLPCPLRRAGADVQGAHDPRGHALRGQHEPGGQRRGCGPLPAQPRGRVERRRAPQPPPCPPMRRSNTRAMQLT